MKYHYCATQRTHKLLYGSIVVFDHPVYNDATVFMTDDARGLCVIQQRYNAGSKMTYWTKVDSWIANDISRNSYFKDYLNKHTKEKDAKGFYPTVPVRKIMWALRMKPLKKEMWETTFDRAFV